jgi:uncharacterized protein (TIGR00255 family)
MIHSMTGFGTATATIGERFSLSVSAKTVNHRYLEVSLRLPEFLWEMEPRIRAIASEMFHRGKLDVAVRAQRLVEPEYTARINRKIADVLVPQLKILMNDVGVAEPLTAADLLRLPDLVEVNAANTDLQDEEREQIATAVREAFGRVAEMRSVEGQALRADIEARLNTIKLHRQSLESQRSAVLAETLESFKQRVQELAQSSGVTVDPDRLAQETVLMAERGDIAEELTRLSSHLVQTRKLLDAAEPAGKKLDFLSQELLREINTLGQKSRSASVRTLVVELKTEVERIREQVQNVE